MSACKYGDPYCPCQDGDTCHYEGKNPMRPPVMTEDALPVNDYRNPFGWLPDRIKEFGHEDLHASVCMLLRMYAVRGKDAAFAEARVAELGQQLARLEQQFAERAEAFEHSMQAAREQVSEATAWIRVVGEETVLAGYPGGDRVQALANVRAALKQLSAAQERVSAEDVAEAVRLSGELRNPAFTCDCAIGNDALEASAELLLRLAGIEGSGPVNEGSSAGNPTQETLK